MRCNLSCDLRDQLWEDEEVLILQVEDDGNEENESYVFVDDDDILTAVFDIFKEKFKDEFDFAEE